MTLEIAFSFAANRPDPTRYSLTLFLLVTMIVGCGLVIALGWYFLNQYSNRVSARGVVIDVLQHLRLRRHAGSLDDVLDAILGPSRSDDDLFVIIKSVERLCGTKKPIQKAGKLVQQPELLRCLALYVDVYDVDFSCRPGWRKEAMRRYPRKRRISSTRNGHLEQFSAIWVVVATLYLGFVFFAMTINWPQA